MTNVPTPQARSVEVALVTGGSRGLGKSMVLSLAKRGIDSIFTYKSRADDARAVVAQVEALGRKAVALQLDVGDSRQFGAFAESVRSELQRVWRRDTIDALVNNAGSGVYAPIASATEAQLDAMFNEHMKAPFFLTQKLLPLMADGGRIVNVSSGLARFSMPGYAPYASMKGAIEVLTRYMAVELGPRGISVNTLAPGAIETDFGGGAVRDNAQLNAMIAGQTALGRVGKPEDIGEALASLLMPESRWINGQRIEVAGGIHL
ncbi:MAG: SDR family oxidoreductase [Myxococcales bacterium]|nr:SDR family oxidoreductase [Myxococcales bacterium]